MSRRDWRTDRWSPKVSPLVATSGLLIDFVVTANETGATALVTNRPAQSRAPSGFGCCLTKETERGLRSSPFSMPGPVVIEPHHTRLPWNPRLQHSRTCLKALAKNALNVLGDARLQRKGRLKAALFSPFRPELKRW